MRQYKYRGREPGKDWSRWFYGPRSSTGSWGWAKECGERRLEELKKKWPTIEFKLEVV